MTGNSSRVALEKRKIAAKTKTSQQKELTAVPSDVRLGVTPPLWSFRASTKRSDVDGRDKPRIKSGENHEGKGSFFSASPELER